VDRYEKLFACIIEERPAAVFLGGDLLPGLCGVGQLDCADFISGYLAPSFEKIRGALDKEYPAVFLILGNDDPRSEEELIHDGELRNTWHYIHEKHLSLAEFFVVGYACVPPSPFMSKDWERYDVSRYVDPGCISPEEGTRSGPEGAHDIRWRTIRTDLERIAAAATDLGRSIVLFHTPPYDTPLDRVALDGKMYQHVPLDVHVGSVAVRQFIEQRQPLMTLHGHVHESARLTGQWKMQIGRTVCINAAHDGPELSLVRFDPACPGQASRDLL
jgi:Icc-related predicted phosphoesterase